MENMFIKNNLIRKSLRGCLLLAAAAFLTFAGTFHTPAAEAAGAETGTEGAAKDNADGTEASETQETDDAKTAAASRTITAGEARKEGKDASASGEGADTKTGSEGNEDTSAQSGTSEKNGSGSGLVSLGIFRTTAYCPCYACSEGYGRHTCTGAIAKANHTIAVDPRVIPYGSRVLIDGIVYTAEDRGGAVKGSHIDIFFDTHAQTRQYGSRRTEVFLLDTVQG